MLFQKCNIYNKIEKQTVKYTIMNSSNIGQTFAQLSESVFRVSVKFTWNIFLILWKENQLAKLENVD